MEQILGKNCNQIFSGAPYRVQKDQGHLTLQPKTDHIGIHFHVVSVSIGLPVKGISHYTIYIKE